VAPTSTTTAANRPPHTPCRFTRRVIPLTPPLVAHFAVVKIGT
jgi:hypothetical protein